ncbi:hypothetical protein ACF0H5_002662 [Mactra antiquata]
MDVTVVGSCNVDLISYVPHLPKPGETLQGSKFSMGYGGKGANQCVMASKLGASTAMISKVGKDTFGDGFIKNFQDLGVNTAQNSIVIVPGANLLLNSDDLSKAESFIQTSKVVVCQLEIDPVISLAALKVARQQGSVKTVFNPAPALPSLDKEFYMNCDVIVPNETEAEILTGLPVQTVEEADIAAKRLRELGCKNVIVTLGSNGCIVLEQSSDGIIHLPAPSVNAVDTTGAGDSFIGSLAYFMSKRPDLSLTECARRAIQIASVSVQYPGTQTSFPTQDKLPEQLFS